jgi:uncharacterized protein YdhG (YjbR/CyaY superfamily)
MTKIIYTNKGEKILVDDCYYDILNQYTWYVCKQKCANTKFKSRNITMHSFIFSEILKQNTKNILIGHFDCNNLNNTLKNLEYNTTQSRISRKNIDKCFFKIKNNFGIKIMNNNKVLVAYYKNIESTQWQLKLWADEYNLHDYYNVENFTEPKNFILYKKKQKKDLGFPKGVTKIENNRKKCYKVMFFIFGIKNKKAKHFKTLKEAIEFQNEMKKQFEIDKENEILNRPIIRNKNGDAIILTSKKEEIIVDESDYYDLLKYNWFINNNGYVISYDINRNYINDRKLLKLSNYIMKTDKILDHIDNIRINIKKENLRVVTIHQNNMNRSKSKNKSSQYLGVCWDKSKNKWISKIKLNGKEKHLGSFKCEIQAAEARDIATKKYFGEYGNLNFPTE